MSSILQSVLSAGTAPMVFFSASEGGRRLGRPTSQILRAVRLLNLPVSRGGSALSAAVLLTPADLDQIESFLTSENQTQPNK